MFTGGRSCCLGAHRRLGARGRLGVRGCSGVPGRIGACGWYCGGAPRCLGVRRHSTPRPKSAYHNSAYTSRIWLTA